MWTSTAPGAPIPAPEGGATPRVTLASRPEKNHDHMVRRPLRKATLTLRPCNPSAESRSSFWGSQRGWRIGGAKVATGRCASNKG